MTGGQDKIPLFSVPHTSHFKIAFSSPEDASKRFPQSVQKTREAIDAIASVENGPANLT